MLLVADDRLLAGVVVAAGWHRLVPSLVDARPVPCLIGVVLCFAFGRVPALVLPLPIVGVHAMTTALADRARHAARSWRDTAELRVSADPADVESVTVRYLMYVLMPAWFVPGIADYLMHRRTRIERTSGLRESAIHSLMMAE